MLGSSVSVTSLTWPGSNARQASWRQRLQRTKRFPAWTSCSLLLARWVRGEIEDGASSGYRLPEQVSASDLSNMLRGIPPTIHVVTKALGRYRVVTLRLASRPAWRLGTASQWVPAITSEVPVPHSAR